MRFDINFNFDVPIKQNESAGGNTAASINHMLVSRHVHWSLSTGNEAPSY